MIAIYNFLEADSSESIIIHDVYKTKDDSETIIKAMYGKWDSKSHITVLEPDIWKRRANLQGHNLQ